MSAVRICPDQDRECGHMERSWCATCPKRTPDTPVAPKCPECMGEGTTTTMDQLPDGDLARYPICNHCNGKGRVATLPAAPAPTEPKCASCRDTGMIGIPGAPCPFCPVAALPAEQAPTRTKFDTGQAREFLVEWHRANFPTDCTFESYIRKQLAGDFAWQLACALAARQAPTEVPKEPKLCDFGNEDDFDEAHDDWERAQRYALVGAMEYNGNTVSYMYSKAKNYGNALLDCCKLLGGEGDVRDRIKALQARQAPASSLAQGAGSVADVENLALVIARLEQIKHISEGSDARGLAVEALVCANAVSARLARTAAPSEWKCFHCCEAFTDEAQAALHFGKTEREKPACQFDVAALRETEALLRSYQAEDTDLHRQMYGMQSQHQIELRREEEKGYARGLKDANHVEPAAPSEGQAIPKWQERTKLRVGDSLSKVGLLNVIQHMEAELADWRARTAVVSEGQAVAWRLQYDDFQHFSGATVAGQDKLLPVKPDMTSKFWDGLTKFTLTPLCNCPAAPAPEGATEDAKDADRFRKAISLDDNAEALYGIVLSNAPDTEAIRLEFDAALAAPATEQAPTKDSGEGAGS